MYKYLPIEQAKVGDIVEAVTTSLCKSYIKNSLYIIDKVYANAIDTLLGSKGRQNNGWDKAMFKLVATKPGSQAKIGDTVKPITGLCQPFTVTNSTSTHLQPGNWRRDCVVVLHKADELEQQEQQEPTTHRNLAFYKRSGKPWTQEEFVNINKYCGNTTSTILDKSYETYRYIFDDKTRVRFMHPWVSQETNSNFKNCKQVAYEDIFQTTDNQDVSTITNNQPKKENTMNELQQLLSTIFGAEKPTTDYDKRPQLLVVVYSLDGKKVATATADSVEQVADEVKRNPSLWGCKVLTYKLNKELFVDVPVSITKARVATASDEE